MTMQQAQGYTTVKFAAACALMSIFIYNLIEFCLVWSQEEDAGFMHKLLASLAMLVSGGLMYVLDSFWHVRVFLLGVGRYKEIRYLDESKFINKKANVVEGGIEIVDKRLNTGNKVRNFHSNSKSTVLKPSDFLKLSKNNHEIETSSASSARNRLRSISLPISNSDEDLNMLSYHKRTRLNEVSKLLNEYKTWLSITGVNIQVQSSRLKTAQQLIGQIFQKEATRQIENLQQIKTSLESVFQLKIVDLQDGFGSNQRTSLKANKTKFKQINQITLDEVQANFVRSSGRLPGYSLIGRAKQDQTEKLKLFQKIKSAIEQRGRLDKIINFGFEFGTNEERLKAIQKLQMIYKSFKENKPLSMDESRASSEHEIKQLIVNYLAAHLNELVVCKAPNARIHFEAVDKETKPRFHMAWVLEKAEALCHYNLLTLTTIDQKTYETKYPCRPEAENVASLFCYYLAKLHQSFRKELAGTSEIEAYWIALGF